MNEETIAGCVFFTGNDLEFAENDGRETEIGLGRVEANGLRGAEVGRVGEHRDASVLSVGFPEHVDPIRARVIAVESVFPFTR